jgi:hypothetical protein
VDKKEYGNKTAWAKAHPTVRNDIFFKPVRFIAPYMLLLNDIFWFFSVFSVPSVASLVACDSCGEFKRHNLKHIQIESTMLPVN